MNEPYKNHHYLPVFYLSQWAGTDGKVVRYYRPHREVVASRITPKRTGYEPGLYGLDGYAPSLNNVIEKEFMALVVDDPAAHALRVLIERDQSKLTPELREAWTRFVMSLHVRTPAKVEYITQQAAQNLRRSLLSNPEEYDAIRTATDPPTLLEWVEQNAPAILPNFGKQMLPSIITHQETGDAIIRMRWWTVEITQEFPDLLTCDHPVFISHGIPDDKCLIAVPLSPRFIFFATRNPATLDRVMARGIVEVTKLLNESIVNQAQKFVYGATDRHLGFVENRLVGSES